MNATGLAGVLVGGVDTRGPAKRGAVFPVQPELLAELVVLFPVQIIEKVIQLGGTVFFLGVVRLEIAIGADGSQGRPVQLVGQVEGGAPQVALFRQAGVAGHLVEAGAVVSRTPYGAGTHPGVLVGLVELQAQVGIQAISGDPTQLGHYRNVALPRQVLAIGHIVHPAIALVPQQPGAPVQRIREGHVGHPVQLVAIVVTHGAPRPAVQLLVGPVGDILDGAGRGVAPEQGALGAVEYLYPGEVVEGHLGAAGAAYVDPVLVHPNRRVGADTEVIGADSADGIVGLVGGLGDGYVGGEGSQVADILGGQVGDLLGAEGLYRDRHILQALLALLGGDDYLLQPLGAHPLPRTAEREG